MTNIQTVVAEAMNAVVGDGTLEIVDLATLDGKTFLPAREAYIQSPAGAKVMVATLDSEGLNHTIVFKGAFHRDTVILQFFSTFNSEYY